MTNLDFVAKTAKPISNCFISSLADYNNIFHF